MWVVRNVLEDFQVSCPLDIFNKTGFQGRPLWGGELWQTLGRKVWEAEPRRDLRTERFRQESKGPEARTGLLPVKNSREAHEPAALWVTREHGHERKFRSHGPWSEGWRYWFHFDCDRKPLDYEWLWAQKKKKKKDVTSFRQQGTRIKAGWLLDPDEASKVSLASLRINWINWNKLKVMGSELSPRSTFKVEPKGFADEMDEGQ